MKDNQRKAMFAKNKQWVIKYDNPQIPTKKVTAPTRMDAINKSDDYPYETFYVTELKKPKKRNPNWRLNY